MVLTASGGKRFYFAEIFSINLKGHTFLRRRFKEQGNG